MTVVAGSDIRNNAVLADLLYDPVINIRVIVSAPGIVDGNDIDAALNRLVDVVKRSVNHISGRYAEVACHHLKRHNFYIRARGYACYALAVVRLRRNNACAMGGVTGLGVIAVWGVIGKIIAVLSLKPNIAGVSPHHVLQILVSVKNTVVDHGYNDLFFPVFDLLPARGSVDRQRRFGVCAAVIHAVADRVP